MLTKRTIDAALNKMAADESKWYDGVKNWATADNYSNLKNVGIGAGTAALVGGATYAASGLVPGLKKKRLARALMALAAGGASGGAAGYYGTDIRNDIKDLYYGAKNMSPADGQFRQTFQERRAANAKAKAERQE